MNLSIIDILSFILFIAFVIGISIYASRKEETSEDYFLAGRNLTWWLIGFSLIASNISTEHFVGMAGRGYELGLAIASYEWMAAITLVIVAFIFLPRFLKSGIYTIPEFLEYRYNQTARSIMAFFMMIAYIFVALASVLYSGALALKSIFDINLVFGVWLIAILAGAYTIYGGLKAVVWSDLIQGIALLLGGLLITIIGFVKIGGINKFLELGANKLHTVLPWNHPEMPWIAVFIGGLWIPNLFYWGLNQFISQRTLGAKSLKEGQKGIILAAFIKLFIPIIIVFPGIMAYELFANSIPQADQAYPIMIQKLLPAGLKGIMFAALFGAVMSSLDSMLNSASTIFTIDIYKKFINKEANNKKLVKIGRMSTAAFVIIGGLWAPAIASFGSVFKYIQMIWGFISPGIVASFLFGIIIKKAPPMASIGAMILGIPVYGACLYFMPETAFLHHMAITFIILIIYMSIITYIKPLKNENTLPVNKKIDLQSPNSIKVGGIIVILLTITLYLIFW